MRRPHGLVMLAQTEDGLYYAACICGARMYGDDEDEAFEAYETHKNVTWLQEATG